MRLGMTAAVLGVAAVLSATAAQADPPWRRLRPRVNIQVTPNTGYYAQPGYYPPQQQQPPVYVHSAPYGGGPGQIAGFQSDMRRQMNGIANDLNERVREGAVNPQATADLNERRNDIEHDMEAAAADGIITPEERAHIQRDVDSMRTLEARYRQQRAYGGGPGYYNDPPPAQDWQRPY